MSNPEANPRSGELRLTCFLVAMSLTLVASEISSPGLGSKAISPRFLFGLLIPALLGLLLTPRKHRLGLGFGSPRRGAIALGLGVPLVVVAMAILASFGAVGAHYGTHVGSPFGLAQHYLPGVFQVEACFRGVLLFGLVPRLSPLTAAAISTLPYGLAHLDKPAAEALGSIPVGFALAALALWTRSIWYGLVLHLLGATALTLFAQRNA